jgi:hypothetical protein
MASGTPEIKAMLERGDYVEAMVRTVELYDYVSFVELEHLLEAYMPVEGNQAIAMGQDEDIIIWGGMSQAFRDLVLALLRSERVSREPSSTLTYLIDGKSISLPLAKRLPKGGYKTPHWLPICFRVASKAKITRRRKGAA